MYEMVGMAGAGCRAHFEISMVLLNLRAWLAYYSSAAAVQQNQPPTFLPSGRADPAANQYPVGCRQAHVD